MILCYLVHHYYNDVLKRLLSKSPNTSLDYYCIHFIRFFSGICYHINNETQIDKNSLLISITSNLIYLFHLIVYINIYTEIINKIPHENFVIKQIHIFLFTNKIAHFLDVFFSLCWIKYSYCTQPNMFTSKKILVIHEGI